MASFTPLALKGNRNYSYGSGQGFGGSGGYGGFNGFGGSGQSSNQYRPPGANAVDPNAGGSGSGSSSSSNYTPGTFTSDVQENPQFGALRQDWKSYQDNLGTNSDIDARNAMARQRDYASGMAKEGLQGAVDRGFGSDTGIAQKFRRTALESGQRASAELNTGLTSDARKKQLDALSGRTGLEGMASQSMLGQQNFGLESWKANQQAAQAAAQLAAMQQQNNFNNQYKLMSSFYTGF